MDNNTNCLQPAYGSHFGEKFNSGSGVGVARVGTTNQPPPRSLALYDSARYQSIESGLLLDQPVKTAIGRREGFLRSGFV